MLAITYKKNNDNKGSRMGHSKFFFFFTLLFMAFRTNSVNIIRVELRLVCLYFELNILYQTLFISLQGWKLFFVFFWLESRNLQLIRFVWLQIERRQIVWSSEWRWKGDNHYSNQRSLKNTSTERKCLNFLTRGAQKILRQKENVWNSALVQAEELEK